MWRLALALCLIATRAFAQAPGCDPPGVSNWTTPYAQGSIQAVSYWVQPKVLSVLFRTQALSMYANVPQSVAQKFSGLTNADSYYNSSIRSRYGQALLAEPTGCPLLNETTGAFLLGEQ